MIPFIWGSKIVKFIESESETAVAKGWGKWELLINTHGVSAKQDEINSRDVLYVLSVDNKTVLYALKCVKKEGVVLSVLTTIKPKEGKKWKRGRE